MTRELGSAEEHQGGDHAPKLVPRARPLEPAVRVIPPELQQVQRQEQEPDEQQQQQQHRLQQFEETAAPSSQASDTLASETLVAFDSRYRLHRGRRPEI